MLGTSVLGYLLPQSGQQTAKLPLPLGAYVLAHPLLDEFECALLLGYLSSSIMHLQDYALYVISMLGDELAVAMPQLADIFVIAWPMLRGWPWGSTGPWLLLSNNDHDRKLYEIF